MPLVSHSISGGGSFFSASSGSEPVRKQTKIYEKDENLQSFLLV